MKVWKITEEWFHDPQKNRIVGYYSARFTPDKIGQLLKQLAQFQFYSFREQLEYSKYNNPSKPVHKLSRNRIGSVLNIGHDPKLVARRCDIDKDDIMNQPFTSGGLSDLSE